MPYDLTAKDAYRRMFSIRAFEEQVLELASEGHVLGSVHLGVGQEAIPVGTLAALREGDKVIGTYRGHGWALACGSDPKSLLAEIAQRADGTNGGRAGSAMLSDPDVGFLGENSIVGAGLPIATGVALASQFRGEDRVVIASCGDGAMNQGATTEAMVFAASKNLPVIFLCENNGWSEMTPIRTTTRGEHLARRGQGIGIESYLVDGGDPAAVFEAVGLAAEQCRQAKGPVLLECKTVRMSGHYNKDVEHYRSQDDIDRAAKGDPLRRLREAGAVTASEASEIERQVRAEVARLADSVRAMPAPSPSGVLEHLYGEEASLSTPHQESVAKELTYSRAINRALHWAMTNRPDVLLYGEDVAIAGGIFGVTRGLHRDFGENRVFDTPIAETAIIGSAVGAAIQGARPVVEIMWADFVFVALDQIINQAANIRYVNRSNLSASMVVRMQQGVTPGSCAQHSQSIEAILSHIPGIKVGMPSTPQDAYAMTLAAIDDNDPVIQIEHRSMYQDKGPVCLGGPSELAHGARVRRRGSDAAIITWGSMVAPSLEAAEVLSAEGLEVSVLDLRWLRPLDDDAIAAIVREGGGTVIVVHEAVRTGGFGAEVSARITERHFNELTGHVHRIATPDTRMPSAPSLQESLLPSAAGIADAVRKRCGR